MQLNAINGHFPYVETFGIGSPLTILTHCYYSIRAMKQLKVEANGP